ncbi:hypothetical protein [Vallitalea sp.]|jgi:hypothetical protein|uniref:hypothetical protein n=1 Tax=Vallitalea sp. TaxID=1882829 RepID=UPI0025FD57F5|nr:hypothetical protein [Vallitalea sp.]MCT4685979.1 hypothetical protein [Vallitalea sp.]
MKNLIKYEFKRDFYKIICVIIGVIVCTYLARTLIYPNQQNKMILFQEIVIIVGFLFVIDKKIVHLAKNVIFENKEHMMLIPKSILQILIANALVVYMYCIIFVSILMSIFDISISTKTLRGFVFINIAFLVYVLFTSLYIISGQIIKKPLFATISGLLVTASIIILLILNGALEIFTTRIVISTLLIILLEILGIIGIAVSLGYKFSKKKSVSTIVVVLIILSILNLGIIIHNYSYRIIENIDIPFTNDERVIGKWKTVDFVEDYQGYTPKDTKRKLYIDSLTFNEDGSIQERKESNWTKGFVTEFPLEQTKSQYIIQEINGNTYLFVQWKSGDYKYRHYKPYYYVLKKVD